MARSAASSFRRVRACLTHCQAEVAATTMAGATVSSVRTLEKKRVRHTSQYGSPRNAVTMPASRNDEANGAKTPAPATKTNTRRKVSSRVGSSLHRRTQAAASRASLQLVAKSERTSGKGNPACASASRCAGSAANRYSHHRPTGVSRSAAVRMEFGGQSTDGVSGGNRRMNPMFAPA